jgi:hypothetical protein
MIPTDTSKGVSTWNGSGWTGLGAPNGPVTSVFVTNNGSVVATDTHGQIWVNVPGSGVWTWTYNNNAAAVAVSADTILEITSNWQHIQQSINVVANDSWSGTSWTNVGTNPNASRLIATPDTTVWGATFSFDWDDMMYPYGNYTGTQYPTSGYSMAVSALAEPMEALSQDQTQILINLPNAPMTPVGGPGGRLVSGIALFATSCANTDSVNCIEAAGGCASGRAPDDTFASGKMVGCGGNGTFPNRFSVCAAGYHVCSAAEWVGNRGSSVPTEDYWTSDSGLRSNGYQSGNCAVVTSGGQFGCGFQNPMRVCTAQRTNDSYGNACLIGNCGFNTVSPDEYFGGCSGEWTAGTLCCSDCANGAPMDVFSPGVVGCGGAVAVTSAATLCGTGSHVCSSAEWVNTGAHHLGSASPPAPNEDYWTADNPALADFSGSTGDCEALTSGGTPCGTNVPMRVCTEFGPGSDLGADHFGNDCTIVACGLGIASDQFFGGCSIDTTAGALCCNECANGPPTDVFPSGMVGCGGSVSQSAAPNLCAQGYHLCSAAEFAANNSTFVAPTADYWTSTPTIGWSGAEHSCGAITNGGNTCGTTPMRVCKPGDYQRDAFGNECNWTGCKLDSTSDTFFGGCGGDTTAGAVCCTGCANGTPTDFFEDDMVGCGGSVSFGNAINLCAPGYHVCSSAEWLSLYVNHSTGGTAIPPTHDYWTADPLQYVNGGTTNDCEVVLSGGTQCTGSAMRVCTTGTDSFGNTCGETGCGLNTTTPALPQFFGGCSAAETAGTLCCGSQSGG